MTKCAYVPLADAFAANLFPKSTTPSGAHQRLAAKSKRNSRFITTTS